MISPTWISALVISFNPFEVNFLYFWLFASLSLEYLLKSSTASFVIVIASTTAKGATYVNRNPTLRGGKIWETAIRRKKG